MKMPKRYGQSRIENCIFCGKQATTQTKEHAPVCQAHKNAKLPPLKCLCGEYVDPAGGKWGLYFVCMHCGNVNARRILENNRIYDASEEKKPIIKPSFNTQKKTGTITKKKFVPKEITITSDDVDYF